MADEDGLVLCGHCQLRYQASRNLGHWGCRRHPQPADPITGRHPCCGTVLDAKRRLGDGAIVRAEDTLGCHQCDHDIDDSTPRIVLCRSYLPVAAVALGRSTERIANWADMQLVLRRHPELASVVGDAAAFQSAMLQLREESCMDPQFYRSAVAASASLGSVSNAVHYTVMILGHEDRRMVTKHGVATTLGEFAATIVAAFQNNVKEGALLLADFMDLLHSDATMAGQELRNGCRANIAATGAVVVALVPIERIDPEQDRRTLANAAYNQRLFFS